MIRLIKYSNLSKSKSILQSYVAKKSTLNHDITKPSIAVIGKGPQPQFTNKYYPIGQFFLHKQFGYRGMVIRRCQYRQPNLEGFESNKKIPYYQIIVHQDDWFYINDVPKEFLVQETEVYHPNYQLKNITYKFPGYDFVSHSDMLPFLPVPDKKRLDPFGLKINELFKHPDLATYFLDDVRMNNSATQTDQSIAVQHRETRHLAELIHVYKGSSEIIDYEIVFKTIGRTQGIRHWQVNLKITNKTDSNLELFDATWITEDSASAIVPDNRKKVHDMPVRKSDMNLYKRRPVLEPFFNPTFYYVFHLEIETWHSTQPRVARGKPSLFNGVLYFRHKGKPVEVKIPQIKLYPPSKPKLSILNNEDDS